MIDRLKSYLQIFIYLLLCFAILEIHKIFILHQYQIEYRPHGVALVEALVLSKVMLTVDHLMSLERYRNRPLIYPVMIRLAATLVALILFDLAELLVKGALHGDLFGDFPALRGPLGMIALVGENVPILAILLLFYAFREVRRFVGRRWMHELFFVGGVGPLEHVGQAGANRDKHAA
jgi:hypothetical protein